MLGSELVNSRTPDERDEGLEILRQTAENGQYADAAIQLGILFFRGEVVPKNIEAARSWLERGFGETGNGS